MKPNILYIEDNPDNMTLVRRVLPAGSFNLIEARNGIQGLVIAESQDINLILLDINLPDIDGYEVARRLRASAKTKVACTPIIALTANALKSDVEKALDAGCDLYMSKPINIQELLEIVETYVDKEAQGVKL